MSTLTRNNITLFWSFRSPYSYLALPRLQALSESTGIEIDMRVVHPNILRNTNYFKTMNALARPYFMRDTQRTAAFLGMPFRRPVPDPIQQHPETLEVSSDQPLARWLGHLGIAAQVTTRPDYYEQQLQANADALTAAGHWGVPTMVYAQETFFGQDRIDVLAWCIEQQTKN